LRFYLSVGFEPQIQVHQKAVEQLTVHLCDSYLDESIWYKKKHFNTKENQNFILGTMIKQYVIILNQC